MIYFVKVSHKRPFDLYAVRTIFEVDIDSFEEKPWKLPGVDIMVFFNFCLNEERLLQTACRFCCHFWIFISF